MPAAGASIAMATSVERHGSLLRIERALIRERQREGIALAKKNNVYRGGQPALPAAKAAELRARLAAGGVKAKLAREFGIDRFTVYRYMDRTGAGN